MRRRPRSAISCSASAARKRAAGQPSLSDCSASLAHITLMAGRRRSESSSSIRAASIGLVVFMPASIAHEIGVRRTNSGQLVVGGERDKLDGYIGDYRTIWLEAVAQPIEIRQDADIKIGVDRLREFGFTGAVVSERKQSDHGAAGLLPPPWPAAPRRRGHRRGAGTVDRDRPD